MPTFCGDCYETLTTEGRRVRLCPLHAQADPLATALQAALPYVPRDGDAERDVRDQAEAALRAAGRL